MFIWVQSTRLLFFAPVLRIFSRPQGYEAFTLQGAGYRVYKLRYTAPDYASVVRCYLVMLFLGPCPLTYDVDPCQRLAFFIFLCNHR